MFTTTTLLLCIIYYVLLLLFIVYLLYTVIKLKKKVSESENENTKLIYFLNLRQEMCQKIMETLLETQLAFDKYKEESIKWDVIDVLEVAKEENITLSSTEAREILVEVLKSATADFGITWANFREEILHRYNKSVGNRL